MAITSSRATSATPTTSTASGPSGFLYVSTTDPWPDDVSTQLDRLPSDWVEEDHRGNPRVRREMEKFLPQPLWVTADGRVHPGSTGAAVRAWMVPTPFRFCLWSGANYSRISARTSPR